MAKAMKKAMKAAMKAASKKVMKKAMKASKKKAAKKPKTMKKKAKKVSTVARNKRAKLTVFRGTGGKTKTVGGLQKSDLKMNKRGKIVSKKSSDAAKKRFAKALGPWTAAVAKARAALKIKGMQVVGGKTPAGQALLKKARSIYKK